jgi:hypothetical protein
MNAQRTDPTERVINLPEGNCEDRGNEVSAIHNTVFKQPDALICHLFHVIYFRLQYLHRHTD